jgi:hypothetical protein
MILISMQRVFIFLFPFVLTLSLIVSPGRALQKAAAAVAVERARRARMAQGGAVNKGGGEKGKGADEREEEFSICNSEFYCAGGWGGGILLPYISLHVQRVCGDMGELGRE